MKQMIAGALVALTLTACAQVAPNASPATADQVQAANAAQLQADWMQSCLLYNGAQKVLIANIDKLNKSELTQALIITRQITPLCLKQPADLTEATTQITSAVTTITILAGVQAAQGAKQ